MDAASVLKQAWAAVVESGVPEEIRPTAFTLAVEYLTNGPPSDSKQDTANTQRRGTSTARAKAKPSSSAANESQRELFATVARSEDFLKRVAQQTGVSLEDLEDVFHVEGGAVELKIPSKDLGDNDKAKTVAVTTLMGGAVFAGSDVISIPFKEIHGVCTLMRCRSSKHGAEYIRDSPGFGSVGRGASSSLTAKTGYERSFAETINRVLERARG